MDFLRPAAPQSAQEVVYSGSNRIGKFNLLYSLLQDGTQRPMLQALFGLGVVLDTFENESGRGKTYIVASDLFQPLSEGEEIPEYRIEFACNQPFPNSEYELRRLNNGVFGFVAIRQIVVRVPPAQLAMRPALPVH